MTVNPVDDPAIITGGFNATINEDGVATGDLNASDIEGLPTVTTSPFSPHPLTGCDHPSAIRKLDIHAQRELLRTGRVPGARDRRPARNHTGGPAHDHQPGRRSGNHYGRLQRDHQRSGVATGDLNASDIEGLTDGILYRSHPTHSRSATIHPQSGNWTYLRPARTTSERTYSRCS